jgi:glutamate racemase
MIGVFDSGLGGLTILKEFLKVLPEYDYCYLGDTLHVPYGNRSDKAVFDLTKKACEYLFDNGCSLIIIACNTASARALPKLQQEYLVQVRQEEQERQVGQGKNILGVIRPVAEELARLTKGKIGVLGTRGTINSNAYVKELDKQRAKLKIFQQACPLLVPLIEENWAKRKETTSILRYYLRDLKKMNVDSLILGCTHYPLLLREIRGIMGKTCQVPNPGEIVAASLQDYLTRHPEIEKNLTQKAKRKYLVTDLNENFKQLAQRFLGEKIKVEQIEY